MEFIWNDGGRSACGFVGLAGDCVTRAIAIGTGAAYRDVYALLGDVALKSPRNGLPVNLADDYLSSRGWQKVESTGMPLVAPVLPKGIVIVHVAREERATSHLCCVIDHVIHDTWNASDDVSEYKVLAYWTAPGGTNQPGISTVGARPTSQRQELNQQEFEKILRRLRALDNTASNAASTEGEKHNALRMMQDLMLRHNLTRDDIVNDDDVGGVQFTRRACPLNSKRAYTWQVMLAMYVTLHIFPTVQFYTSPRGHRTMFWFYGPRSDVENCMALFKELLLTIASSAMLSYGGYTRGSGASYAEGYVAGLPRNGSTTPQPASQSVVSEQALIQTRTIALQEAASDWLFSECNIRLVRSRRSGRGGHDPGAANHGRKDGASHQITTPNMPKRLT